MIRYSCADFAFPHLTHENSLKLIKMMGIDAVDIGLFQDRSHIQPSDQLDKPEEKGLLLKQKCADLGLAISDIFMQTSLDFGEVAISTAASPRGIRASGTPSISAASTQALTIGMICGNARPTSSQAITISRRQAACICPASSKRAR